MNNSQQAERLSTFINTERLWQRHMSFAKFGAIDNDGVNRQALSQEDIMARRELINWASSRGYDIKTDEIANLFITRSGRNNDLPAVATGSHMDSQPLGGRFDGIYGVLAGMEVFESLDDAGIETDHPLMIVAWTNEEGSRFSPGAMGSSIFSGERTLSEFSDITDSNGVRLVDAIETTLADRPDVPLYDSRPQLKAYLEAHIEQGPILERKKHDIGVVTGIQGVRMFDVEVTGSCAHAGTTPVAVREDALREAVRAINLLFEEMSDPTDTLRFTVGRLHVSPNSSNTIPNNVKFSIDLRHPNGAVLAEKGGVIEGICQKAMDACSFSIKETFYRDPCLFPQGIVESVKTAVKTLSISSSQLMSGAFHDALFVSDLCPTGMIFVPSVDGISHNPAEYTSAKHLAAGARVLGLSLLQLSIVEYGLSSSD